MRKYLILILICAMLIVPAFAQKETTTAPESKVIWSVDMELNPDTTGSFTATLEDGTAVTGDFSYIPAGITYVPLTATVDLDGDTSTMPFYTPLPLKMSLWHGDTSNDTRQIKLGYGQYDGLWNNVVVSDVPRSPIKTFTITADKTVVVNYEYRDAEEAAKQLSGNKNQSILDFAWTTFWDVYAFLGELWYWLTFFFIDNLALILALFFAVPMAFAAKNSRGNVERFYRQYFKTLRGLFEFILMIWRMLLEGIGTVIGWFRVI
jgi:hypothetical protein